MSARRGFSALRLPAPLRRFAKNEQGVTAIEFALVLPIVVLLLLGCFEVPRFVLVYQRIARTSAGVADLIAQADEPVLGNQMQDIFLSGALMMQPYDIVANGMIIVSSINHPAGDDPIVTWQTNNGGKATAGGKAVISRVGAEGEDLLDAFPDDLIPAVGEEVLTAEVFFDYKPVFSTLIYEGSQLYMISYTRPRNKNLITKPGKAGSESAS